MADSASSSFREEPEPFLRFRARTVIRARDPSEKEHFFSSELEPIIRRIIANEFTFLAEEIFDAPVHTRDVAIYEGSIIVSFVIIVGVGTTAVAKLEELYGSLEKLSIALERIIDFSLQRIDFPARARMDTKVTPLVPDYPRITPLPKVQLPSQRGVPRAIIASVLVLFISVSLSVFSYLQTQETRADISARMDSLERKIDSLEGQLQAAKSKLDFAATLIGERAVERSPPTGTPPPQRR